MVAHHSLAHPSLAILNPTFNLLSIKLQGGGGVVGTASAPSLCAGIWGACSPLLSTPVFQPLDLIFNPRSLLCAPLQDWVRKDITEWLQHLKQEMQFDGV